MQMIKKTTFLPTFVVMAALGCAATPALALDDDGSQSLFKTFTGIISSGIGIPGLTRDDSPPQINYHERPPLVLPKTQNLRAPMPPVSARNRAWPKDYDKERARRAAAGAAGAVPRAENGTEILSARYLRDTGRLARNPARDPASECETGDPLQRPCDPTKLWSILKNNKLKDSTKDLIPGQEPPRTALTDPPVGLRTPSRRVKATWEAPPDDPGGAPDPRKAIREEAKRDDQFR